MISVDITVIFNVAWMEHYRGEWGVGTIINGGLFISQNHWGGEMFNFKKNENGTKYGYVEPGESNAGNPRNINISNLITRPGAVRTVPSLNDVLIAWVARPPTADETVMVGWYKDATLFRSAQQPPISVNRTLPNGNIQDYFARAEDNNCVLLPVADRTVIIPRSKVVNGVRTTGVLGHSNLWYARSQEGIAKKVEIINFVNAWDRAHPVVLQR